MGNHTQKQKLLNIFKILYKYTDELHPLSAPQIADKLKAQGIECERKSIYRDIECLNEFGIEIMQSTFPSGYYCNERLFETPELRMLVDSVKSSEFITEKKTSEMINKLKRLTSVYLAEELDESCNIYGRPKIRNEGIYYNIDNLHTAIRSGKKVHFSYYRHIIQNEKLILQKSHEFTVSPYALIWNDGKYYLVANYDKYNDLSHYRVDRMKKVEVLADDVRPLSEVSKFTDGFDEAKYVSSVFEMYAGNDLSSIELKCEVSSIEHVMEKFGQDIKYNSINKNSFTVKVNAVINDGLISWILAQRGKVSVMYPLSLAEAVKNTLNNMLNAYGNI